MQTTTTHVRRDRLETALERPSRELRHTRPRPRTKRASKPPVPRPRTDPRAAAFKRQLQQTPNGRHALRLMDDLARVETTEEVAKCGLDAAEATEATTRERFLRAHPGRTAESIRQAESLQVRLLSAESETRRWRAELARHHGEREWLEAQIQHLAGYL